MNLRSLICSVATAGLVTTGLAAAPAPATAVSGSILYDCTWTGGSTGVASAVIDTDIPATLAVGQQVPVTVTASVTLPVNLSDSMRENITSYDGTALADGYVDSAIRQASLTIPRTTIPIAAPGTAITVVGSGPAGPVGAAIPVTMELTAGNFTMHINGYDLAGDPVLPAGDVTCIRQAGQNFHVDTVTVVPTPTTTTLTVTSPVEYGAAPDVTAAVATTGSNAKPAGTVEFTFEGKTVKVAVKGGKAKATLGQALTMGSRTVSATFIPTDTNLAPSVASKAVTVVRGQTTTTATAVYRDARNRLVGKALVEALNATAVDGDVKLVLRRDGVKLRTAVIELNSNDRAKKVFKRISKPGSYKLVARYLGSDTLRRSVDRVKLNV